MSIAAAMLIQKGKNAQQCSYFCLRHKTPTMHKAEKTRQFFSSTENPNRARTYLSTFAAHPAPLVA
jgi:hypothetical protein